MSRIGTYIACALTAAAIAASVTPDTTKSDPLDSNKPLIVVPGCISKSVRDEEARTTTLWKRERQCEGETPRESKQ